MRRSIPILGVFFSLAASMLAVEPSAVVVKRRADATEDDLRKQLLAVPDIGLTQTTAAKLYAEVESAAKGTTAVRPDTGGLFYTRFVNKDGSTTLTWARGADAARGKEEAEALHVLSTALREAMMKATPTGDVRPDADKVRAALAKGEGVKAGEWRSAAAVPTLVQLLQAEDAPLRRMLVDQLAEIEGRAATEALARRALYELAPDIREQAVQALAKRPEEDYWPVLAEGFRSPWAPAADHAAEAVAALGSKSRLRTLVDLLKEPDPALATKGDKGPAVRELVRFNHLANCMVCHAPSTSKSDYVRGRVPSPGQDPPPLYYRDTRGTFVRADVTYLRQLFSVVQPVPSPGKWPGHQRYDYLIRTRPATAAEAAKAQLAGARPRTDLNEADANAAPRAYPQREAVLFALRGVTGKDAGQSYEQWSRLVRPRDN